MTARTTRSARQILLDIANRTALCLGAALLLTAVTLGCGGDSEALDPNQTARVRLGMWATAVAIGPLWGALRPLGRTMGGASILGALVMPAAVYFAVIVMGAPVLVANIPRDLVATVVGGAVMGAGLFLVGVVLGHVEAPPWLNSAVPASEDPPAATAMSDDTDSGRAPLG